MSEADDRFCAHGEPLGTRCRQCENPEPPRSPDLSLRNVFDLITPPGTDGGALLDSLKSARRAPVPQDRPAQPGSLPEDPFTPGKMAAAAIADWYHDLLETDIPLASVEHILGYMMAAAAAFTAGAVPEGEQ